MTKMNNQDFTHRIYFPGKWQPTPTLVVLISAIKGSVLVLKARSTANVKLCPRFTNDNT